MHTPQLPVGPRTLCRWRVAIRLSEYNGPHDDGFIYFTNHALAVAFARQQGSLVRAGYWPDRIPGTP